MKSLRVCGALIALLTLECTGLPLDRKDDEFWKQQAAVRATLITKDSFTNREKKSGILPEPFVVSTRLNVQTDGRRGRSYPDKDGSTVVEGIRVPDDESDRIVHRNGRYINNIFVPNDAPLPAERVITSGRQPRMFSKEWNVMPEEGRSASGLPYPAFNYDDHYGGRTPDLPDSLAVESRTSEIVVKPDGSEVSGESRDYSYHAGNTDAGRPVYYVVEEPDSLHADRSPYNYEPADTQTSFSSAVADYTQAGANDPLGLGGTSAQADSNDFIIKEHTYTMCPGCPTFSIPIPIPKATLEQPQRPQPGIGGYPYYDSKIDYQFARNKTFLEKIGDRIVSTVQGIQSSALKMFNPIVAAGGNLFSGEDNSVDSSNVIEEKVGNPASLSDDDNGFNYLPMIVGGVAAAAFGAFALISSQPESISVDPNSRSLKEPTLSQPRESSLILEKISQAQEKFSDR